MQGLIIFLLIFSVYFLYGLICPLGKIALDFVPSLFFNGWRILISGIIVLNFHYFFRSKKVDLSSNNLKLLLFVSFFSIYAATTLQFISLEKLGAGAASFFYSLQPFSAALLAYLFLRQKLTRKQWIGLIISLIALFPLFFNRIGQNRTLISFLPLSEISILLAIIIAPLGWLMIQRKMKTKKMDLLQINGFTLLFGGLMMIFNSFIVDNWSSIFTVQNLTYFLFIFFISVLITILSSILYFDLLKRCSFVLLSFAGFITPLIATLFDKIFFGIEISSQFYWITSITFLGFLIFYADELSRQIQENL